MPCADCFTTEPEPFDTEQGVAYWFLIDSGSPTHMGVKKSGDVEPIFAVSLSKSHLEPEEGQEVICCECFDKRYPPPLSEDPGAPL